jgi:hypothetical protein
MTKNNNNKASLVDSRRHKDKRRNIPINHYADEVLKVYECR